MRVPIHGAPFHADARYRIVAEPRVVEMLALYGWVHTFRAGEQDAALREARAHLDQLVLEGLPFRLEANGGRAFDPAEVVNFSKWLCFRNKDREDCFVATGRRSVQAQYAVAGIPPDPRSLEPRRFAVTLQRTFNLEFCRTHGPRRLRLPLPLEDPALRDLSVQARAPLNADAELAIAPGRLEAKLWSPREGEVTLGADIVFTADPASKEQGAISQSDMALYTRHAEGLIQVSARVAALAQELAGAERDPSAVLHRFWNFILDRLRCGIVHYDALDATDLAGSVLREGWFDCQLGSALLVALCRAREIPARLVGGYLLYSAGPTNHYWMEAWVDGAWHPFDTISADLSAQGRDAAWRDHFFGRLDYRMKTQMLPRFFHDSPSLRAPPAWHIVTRPSAEGVEIGVFANETGALVYRDSICVRPMVNATPL